MNKVYNKEHIQRIGCILVDTSRPLKERFRALFTLKNIGGEAAIENIAACFDDESALLKHECAYCLGQMQDSGAVPFLVKILKDGKEDPMVRHEAGEALGAIGDGSVLHILKEFSTDDRAEVAETCQLALERIAWLHRKSPEGALTSNPYSSVDPAPPLVEQSVERLTSEFLNEDLPLFERYRAMFTLRNMGGSQAAAALAKGLRCTSALFRHEVAYVLGQMQEPVCIEQLKENLIDKEENPMVRHECAEALGSIATEECTIILQDYVKDEDRVVRESCEVALDICDYANSPEFQYADAMGKVKCPDES